MKKNEWMVFNLIEEKKKTGVYSVKSKISEAELGKIKWYPQWRQYVFIPTIEFETIYSSNCLYTLTIFIEELNSLHKIK